VARATSSFSKAALGGAIDRVFTYQRSPTAIPAKYQGNSADKIRTLADLSRSVGQPVPSIIYCVGVLDAS